MNKTFIIVVANDILLKDFSNLPIIKNAFKEVTNQDLIDMDLGGRIPTIIIDKAF